MERAIEGQAKVTTTYKLNGQDVIRAMRSLGLDVPSEAKVVFVVPGGADWSHSRLDITDENPLFVSFSVETDEGEKNEKL